MKILDRYVIRELLLPIGLSLLVLTFLVTIPTILRDAEALIVKGIAWSTFVHVLVLLLPSSLSLTIPMSVLLGILIGFGRLSADREFVALQACGVSPFRLVPPVAFVALVAMAATAHQIIVALPDANQTYRELVFNVIANRAESNVKPRVFYDEFPNRTIYARDVMLFRQSRSRSANGLSSDARRACNSSGFGSLATNLWSRPSRINSSRAVHVTTPTARSKTSQLSDFIRSLRRCSCARAR